MISMKTKHFSPMAPFPSWAERARLPHWDGTVARARPAKVAYLKTRPERG